MNAQTIRSAIDWQRRRWNEAGAADDEGPHLFRLEMRHQYEGELAGTGIAQYLITEEPGGSASFIGLEKVSATLAGREGSFVLQHAGTMTGDRIVSTLGIVPGSGRGALASIRGQTAFDIGHHEERYALTLDYALE
jgi:hypothetical protein